MISHLVGGIYWDQLDYRVECLFVDNTEIDLSMSLQYVKNPINIYLPYLLEMLNDGELKTPMEYFPSRTWQKEELKDYLFNNLEMIRSYLISSLERVSDRRIESLKEESDLEVLFKMWFSARFTIKAKPQ